MLHYLEGLSLSEAASRTGISKNAAWKRLRSGLQALRAGMPKPPESRPST